MIWNFTHNPTVITFPSILDILGNDILTLWTLAIQLIRTGSSLVYIKDWCHLNHCWFAINKRHRKIFNVFPTWERWLKNIARHTAHTIVSWPNLTYWSLVDINMRQRMIFNEKLPVMFFPSWEIWLNPLASGDTKMQQCYVLGVNAGIDIYPTPQQPGASKNASQASESSQSCLPNHIIYRCLSARLQ